MDSKDNKEEKTRMQGTPFNEHSYHRLFCKGSDVPLPAQPGLVPLLSIILKVIFISLQQVNIFMVDGACLFCLVVVRYRKEVCLIEEVSGVCRMVGPGRGVSH